MGNCQARIITFIGGPCTEGAGKVVNRELTEEMRSHKVCASPRRRHSHRQGACMLASLPSP